MPIIWPFDNKKISIVYIMEKIVLKKICISLRKHAADVINFTNKKIRLSFYHERISKRVQRSN